MRLRLVHVFTVSMSLRFLRGQAGFMRDHGFDVTCVSSPGPEQAEFARDEGAALVSVPMARAITPFADLTSVVRLLRLFRALRPAIVHSHTPKGGLLGMIAAWVARVPVRVYHMRGLPFETARGLSRRVLILSERISCALAHRVLCNSQSLRAVALEHRLCAPSKIATLLGGSGNGVDAVSLYTPDACASQGRALRRDLAIADGAPVVAFVGRIVRDKGVPELVDAWQRVRQRFPAAHLVLAGPDEARDPIPQLTHDVISNDPSIHLLGSVDDPRVVYAASDVVVLPSHREGFPNVPLEAAAMERPVITTRVTGCIDSVEDGVTGTLVRAGRVDEISAAIAGYLEMPERARAHGRAGRIRVLQSFEQRALWAALLGEYDALLAARALARPNSPDQQSAGDQGAGRSILSAS